MGDSMLGSRRQYSGLVLYGWECAFCLVRLERKLSSSEDLLSWDWWNELGPPGVGGGVVVLASRPITVTFSPLPGIGLKMRFLLLAR